MDMAARNNDTFWRVFSNNLTFHFELYSRLQLLKVLEILDANMG